MQKTSETQVRSLGQEDPLEEGMATHSSALAWRIPWTEEPGGLQSMGSTQRVGHEWSNREEHKWRQTPDPATDTNRGAHLHTTLVAARVPLKSVIFTNSFLLPGGLRATRKGRGAMEATLCQHEARAPRFSSEWRSINTKHHSFQTL